VQFETAAQVCRRCKRSLLREPRPLPVPVPAGRTVRVKRPKTPSGELLRQALALVLWAVRVELGLPQRKLARRMGCPRTYISKIENDKAMPTLWNLERVAAALEMRPSELLRLAETLQHMLQAAKHADVTVGRSPILGRRADAGRFLFGRNFGGLYI
jgi:transcriptional regulator with XRE-family HTH domain